MIDFYRDYDTYKFNELSKRRCSFDEFQNHLTSISTHESFNTKIVGYSIENRPIRLLSYGKGIVNILLWSQMHGDEATATMAMFDIWKFLIVNGDEFDSFREQLINGLTIHFVPVLNPDGLERFCRQNAIGIDLNRDAKRLATPEAQLLKSLQQQIKPEYGFNLHDQDIHYTVGESKNPATISFLAPPFDSSGEFNQVREKAARMIGQLYQELQQIIPGQVAKFTDEYEPRAFGDNIQKWGTSTILVESGGFQRDPEKQEIRKLNFAILLSAFQSILSNTYIAQTLDTYHKIPFNTKYLFDLLIRNTTISTEGKRYIVDIGINYEEITDGTEFYRLSTIEDIGDLDNYSGFEIWDAEGAELRMGTSISLVNEKLDIEKIGKLLNQGIIAIETKDFNEKTHTRLPINIYENCQADLLSFTIGNKANALFYKNDKLIKAMINGFLVDLNNLSVFSGNGIIYSSK